MLSLESGMGLAERKCPQGVGRGESFYCVRCPQLHRYLPASTTLTTTCEKGLYLFQILLVERSSNAKKLEKVKYLYCDHVWDPS